LLPDAKDMLKCIDGWTNEMKKAHIVLTRTKSSGLITEAAHAAARSLTKAGWIIETVDLSHRTFDHGGNQGCGQPAGKKIESSPVIDCDLLVLAFATVCSAIPTALRHWIESSCCDWLVRGTLLPNTSSCKQVKRIVIIAVSDEMKSTQHVDIIDAMTADVLRTEFEQSFHKFGFSVLQPLVINSTSSMRIKDINVKLRDIARALSQLDNEYAFIGAIPSQVELVSCKAV